MATPHIKAEVGDIAETVLMPGDPLRAKYIAEHYLEHVVKFNEVRNMFGYTGYYKGKKVSVMGSGMGMPSIGIYSYELFKFYNVNKIIRIGSCGALSTDLKLFDLILVDKSYTDSSYGYIQNGSKAKIINSSSKLTNHIEEIAKEKGINIIRGNVYSSDVIYRESDEFDKEVFENNCIVAEMETYALFHNAEVLNKEASCLLTVSNSLITKEETTADEREKSFCEMMELALDSIL